MTKKRIPNLFIVGAMKSGTTSIHNYLNTHPEIFMSKKPKEPRYFVKELNWSKGEDWYLSLFELAGDARIIGESSTDYTKLPVYQGVAQNIASFNPEARIIYIMRDPVERSISHYWWDVQYSAEGRNMLTAIQKVTYLTDFSYYAMQLEPYINIFGRERVMVLTLEELSTAPDKIFPQLFEWLGVDPSFQIPSLNQRYNTSPEKVKKVFGSSILSHLRGSLLWNAMKRIISPSARRNAIKLLSRPVEREISEVDQVIDYLRPIQQKQTEELCTLLGREFLEWKTLYGTKIPQQ